MPIPALAITLLPLLPKVVDAVLDLYDAIAADPQTPEATKAQIDQLVADIRATNAAIQAAPLPGDEPNTA